MVTQLPETFPGARFCKVMQASVDAILAPMGIRRPVISRGEQFMNVDTWTAELFVGQLCEHFSKTPTQLPSRAALQEMLRKVNAHKVPHPHIVVAQMPARTTHQTVLAIVGGGYHEAWHTKYSKRSPMSVLEAHSVLEAAEGVLHAGGTFDAKTRGLMLTLQHLIEDIRIERRGNEDFPGAIQPMRDLQDFILALESRGRQAEAQRTGTPTTPSARTVLLSCFRDLGLDYDTPLARETLDFYERSSPEAVALLKPGGVLEPFLRQAQELTREDQIGAHRLSLQMVAALCATSRQSTSQDTLRCSACKADAKELVFHAVTDAAGNKLRGRARVECLSCGHTEECVLPDNSLNLSSQEDTKQANAPQPKLDGVDAADVKDDFDGFGDDRREHARDQPPSEQEAELLRLLVLAILQGGGLDPMDGRAALGFVIAAAVGAEQRELLSGERLWKPVCPSADQAYVMREPQTPNSARIVTDMLREANSGISHLRSRFRSLFRAQEMTDITHGVRVGRQLSERMLIDSRIDLMTGSLPSRPYLARGEQVENSIALAVCLDQSGSMTNIRMDMATCALLFVDPIDKVNGATMVFGFRDCYEESFEVRSWLDTERGQSVFHRAQPVAYDVFKTWDEQLDGAKWRFAHTRAEGGTPMADGVQFGLAALNERQEAHRILAVLTDGAPDHPHEQVIRRQLRLAKKGGITVIGIGVGGSAKGVSKLFPQSAWAPSVQELPPVLLNLLQTTCDFSGLRRGRRAQLDGQVVRVRR